jgi:hypothetical protein
MPGPEVVVVDGPPSPQGHAWPAHAPDMMRTNAVHPAATTRHHRLFALHVRVQAACAHASGQEQRCLSVPQGVGLVCAQLKCCDYSHTLTDLPSIRSGLVSQSHSSTLLTHTLHSRTRNVNACSLWPLENVLAAAAFQQRHVSRMSSSAPTAWHMQLSSTSQH